MIEIETTDTQNGRTALSASNESSVSVNNASILLSTELARTSTSSHSAGGETGVAGLGFAADFWLSMGTSND